MSAKVTHETKLRRIFVGHGWPTPWPTQNVDGVFFILSLWHS